MRPALGDSTDYLIQTVTVAESEQEAAMARWASITLAVLGALYVGAVCLLRPSIRSVVAIVSEATKVVAHTPRSSDAARLAGGAPRPHRLRHHRAHRCAHRPHPTASPRRRRPRRIRASWRSGVSHRRVGARHHRLLPQLPSTTPRRIGRLHRLLPATPSTVCTSRRTGTPRAACPTVLSPSARMRCVRPRGASSSPLWGAPFNAPWTCTPAPPPTGSFIAPTHRTAVLRAALVASVRHSPLPSAASRSARSSSLWRSSFACLRIRRRSQRQLPGRDSRPQLILRCTRLCPVLSVDQVHHLVRLVLVALSGDSAACKDTWRSSLRAGRARQNRPALLLPPNAAAYNSLRRRRLPSRRPAGAACIPRHARVRAASVHTPRLRRLVLPLSASRRRACRDRTDRSRRPRVARKLAGSI